jgi:hypothetical protein
MRNFIKKMLTKEIIVADKFEKLFEIDSFSKSKKSIFLSRIFQGHLIRKGHDRYANFFYKIEPNSSNSITVFGDDSAKTIFEDIEKTINNLNAFFNSSDISIGGVSIYLYNFDFHDTDSKYTFFNTELKKEFIFILNYYGIKTLDKQEYRISTKMYDSPNNSSHIADSYIQIGFLPQINIQTPKLRLPVNVEDSIDDFSIGYSQFTLQLKIFPQKTQISAFTIYTESNEHNIQFAYCLSNALRDFIDESEKINIKLGRFDIWYNLELIQNDSSYGIYDFTDYTYRYTSTIHWKLKEIFMKYGAIYED